MAQQKKPSILEYFDVEAPETTEFRRLLHNINGSGNGGEKRALLVTSAILSEGKSIVSAFLAMTAAVLKKKKTLLIDFDLRRPTVHRLFSLPLDKGVSDILMDKRAARSVVKNTSEENLDIMTAGRMIHNPSEVINGVDIHRIMDEMKFYYDLILVDSPPLVPVMDPLILLDEVDGAIMVVKAGGTQKSVVTRASELLAGNKGKFIGVVVNNLDRALPHYYDYNYYGYQYKPKSAKS